MVTLLTTDFDINIILWNKYSITCFNYSHNLVLINPAATSLNKGNRTTMLYDREMLSTGLDFVRLFRFIKQLLLKFLLRKLHIKSKLIIKKMYLNFQINKIYFFC